jgi:hypothetical protein
MLLVVGIGLFSTITGFIATRLVRQPGDAALISASRSEVPVPDDRPAAGDGPAT